MGILYLGSGPESKSAPEGSRARLVRAATVCSEDATEVLPARQSVSWGGDVTHCFYTSLHALLGPL